MNRILLCLALAIATAAFAADAPQPPELRPLMQQPKTAHVTAEVLKRVHYKGVALDDALSEKIFDHYLKSLDSERLFFLQTDIDALSAARTRLDDAILDEDLSLPFAIFNTYTRRASERFAYARTLLKAGFDFRGDEGYRFQREKEAWPQSRAEARELWRKRVKNDWLTLKIAGKDDKSIAKTLDKRFESSLKRIAKLKSEDAFQIFMNAYTMSVEPHTNYLGPTESEDFDISMKLSLEGIGAVLEEKDEYVTIKEVLAGGPAALSGKLKPGDRIVGVTQGVAGTATDVVGWRLTDAVRLIRGAADTVVVLDVLPAAAGPAGKPRALSLVRKKISLESQAAKKSVLDIDTEGKRRHIGVITLPSFYEDFEGHRQGEQNFRSASRDVEKLLEELKLEKVDAVLIDLRNNGGGSLSEAINVTGLFIDTGPVVQQRDARGRITVGRDTRAGATWDGPLGVLINRGSASASEIFAAAIQDYRRGIIIGEPSFGKGTVQTILDLEQITRKPKTGELKMTIAQFFRIDGSTTQLKGVTPDISLPSGTDAEHFGESSFDNALPWMQIAPASYETIGTLEPLLPRLKAQHAERIARDPEFQSLQEDIAEIKRQRQQNLLSLNEAQRRKENAAREARAKQRAKLTAGEGSAKVSADKKATSPEEADPDEIAEDLAGKTARDSLLKEAAHVLGDEVSLLIARPDAAAGLLRQRH